MLIFQKYFHVFLYFAVFADKRFSPNNTIQSSPSATSSPVSEKRAAITPNNKKSTSTAKRANQTDMITTASPVANKKSHAKGE